MEQYKTGYIPSVPNKKNLKLSTYLTLSELPTRPYDYTDNINMFSDWGMLANDTILNNVSVTGIYGTMLFNRLGGKIANFDNEAAIKNHSELTGYVPNQKDTDRGESPINVFDYRINTGLIDMNGRRHTINCYVRLSDLEEVLLSVYIFKGVEVGFYCPNNVQSKFDNKEPFTYVATDTPSMDIYMLIIGYDCKYIYGVIWGKVQKMTYGFYNVYSKEAFLVFSEEMLNNGRSIDGFDVDALLADIEAIKA